MIKELVCLQQIAPSRYNVKVKNNYISIIIWPANKCKATIEIYKMGFSGLNFDNDYAINSLRQEKTLVQVINFLCKKFNLKGIVVKEKYD